jgi:hypothetical protein
VAPPTAPFPWKLNNRENGLVPSPRPDKAVTRRVNFGADVLFRDQLRRPAVAKRSISRTARSVASNRRAPATEVILPPSNAPTTERPSTRANSNSAALHSVGIGTPPGPEINRSANWIFSDREPRCTCPYEKSGLIALPHASSVSEVTSPQRFRSSVMRQASVLARPRGA